jgi:hypothetical protein
VVVPNKKPNGRFPTGSVTTKLVPTTVAKPPHAASPAWVQKICPKVIAAALLDPTQNSSS